MDRVPNSRIKELCGVDERIDECVLHWFSHIEMLKGCLKKRGQNVGQVRRMVYDENQWLIYKGKCLGHSPGDEPIPLLR